MYPTTIYSMFLSMRDNLHFPLWHGIISMSGGEPIDEEWSNPPTRGAIPEKSSRDAYN